MPFSLSDVRFTSRRDADGVSLLYPRLMRDQSSLPKIAIAVRHFESMLGRERREFDGEVLVQFFGDHKVARCIVSCLARAYRFRARRFDEVVGPRALRRLERRKLTTPKALRLALFDRLNAEANGFLSPTARVETLAALEGELGLRPGELERLLFLDAEEHAVLVRVGAEPRPEDVAAQLNFSALEALVRHASVVELHVAASARALHEAARTVAELDAVEVSTGADLVRFHGRRDALGGWGRHGRRVARAVVQILLWAGPRALAGTAHVHLRDRQARLPLTPELLSYLGARQSTGDLPRPVSERLVAELRRASPGAAIRRLPDPQPWADGVVVPDLMLVGERGRTLVCQGLPRVVAADPAGDPYLFLGTRELSSAA